MEYECISPDDPIKAFVPNLDKYTEHNILERYKACRSSYLDLIRNDIFAQLKDCVDAKKRSYEPISVITRNEKKIWHRYTDKAYKCHIRINLKNELAYVEFGIAFANPVVIDNNQEIQSNEQFARNFVGDVYGFGNTDAFEYLFLGDIIDALNRFSHYIVKIASNYLDAYISALILAENDKDRAFDILSKNFVVSYFQYDITPQQKFLWNQAYAKYSLDYINSYEVRTGWTL